MTPDPFLLLVIALIGCILILILVSLRARRERIPWKGIRYDDMDPTRQPEKTYYDPETGLTGKPDWIIDSWRGPVPIEVKSGATPEFPIPAHVLQLAAYCYLIESCEGKRVRRGILRYPDTSFEISYTIKLRRRLLETIAALREAEAAGFPRSHRDIGKCRACGYRARCNERLG